MPARDGMRFQTRLMLTMIAIIIGVMVLITFAYERKIRDAYTAQFKREFQNRTEALEESRADRSREFLDLCSELAADPYVVAHLRGDPGEDLERAFWMGYLSSVMDLDSVKSDAPQWARAKGRTGGGPGGGIGSEILARLALVGTVNTDLEFSRLLPPGPEAGRKANARRTPFKSPRFLSLMEEILAKGKQTIAFIPLPSANGPASVQEVVLTPVFDPETRSLLGLFLRGTSAETEAQRRLAGYEQAFGKGQPVLSGTYLDGTLYSRSENEEFLESGARIIGEHLRLDPGVSTLQFEADLGEFSYSFHLVRLTETDITPAAFQVDAFPLQQMKEDLQELRIRGSGIGLGVVLIGWLAAYFLARNLAVPLRELSKGTQAIREGALDHRVQVRSRDEIGHLADSFNQMAEELKQKALYRELLGKVSDETVAQALVSGTLDLELGGEMKEVSVLFCDIRGFTDLTQDMHPSEVIEMMNDHMSAMTEVVRRHYGVVDKFVGDEVMAVFGALKSYGNDAANAAACALEMISIRDRMNREHQSSAEKTGWSSIEIGVGVATGEVIAGCMGSSDRLNYTVLGARVNLAARLCSAAGRMEAVIDDATAEELGSDFETDLIPDLRLKGFRETVSAYRVHRKAPDDPDGSDNSLTPPQTASASDRNRAVEGPPRSTNPSPRQ